MAKNNKNTRPLSYEEFIKRNDLIIMIDNQEKVNYHITNYLKKHGIKYDDKKHLKAGDYAFSLGGKAYKVVIERKNSLNELSGNLSTKEMRDRFYREFDKVKSCNIYLLIENDNMDNMMLGNYGTDYHKNSFTGNMLLLAQRYRIFTYFISKYMFAELMLKIFYYNYYENFKEGLAK